MNKTGRASGGVVSRQPFMFERGSNFCFHLIKISRRHDTTLLAGFEVENQERFLQERQRNCTNPVEHENSKNFYTKCVLCTYL